MPHSPYLRDLLNQPKAVHDTLLGLHSFSLPAKIPDSLKRGEFQRVVLTGMGSSYFAFHPLYQTLLRQGVEAYLVETSELLYTFTGLLKPDTLVIAVSQSGESAEIVSLISRKGALGFTLLGVCNSSGSTLAEAADCCVLTRAGEEAAVSCKTYLSSLLALAWLGPALLGVSPEPALVELEPVETVIGDYLAGWQQHVADLKVCLQSARDLFIVGRGISLAAAGTGGLITKESAHFHAEGMSSAAFRHGPFEMISPETFVLVLEGLGAAVELNRRLYADILAVKGLAGLAARDASETVFRLPPVSSLALPLVEILPVQMMTLALADLKGHEAGRFSLGSKVTTTE